MDNGSSNFKLILKKAGKLLLNLIKGILIKIALPVIIIIVLLSGIVYFITVDDGTYKESDWSSTPFAAGQYAKAATIDSSGSISTGNTPQEIWDKNLDEDGRTNQYLDNATELAKLMNAEMVTQFLDTRSNPDDPIDWDIMTNPDSKKVQGIIKLKRADNNGNTSTMTYMDPDEFQYNVDTYNKTGDESAKNAVLTHFTLNQQNTASSDGQAPTIESGTTINVPEGLGNIYPFMGWQKITSPSSTQYKLREKAGMNFDSDGLGVINGRYVIACTTTFGKVGDYVDFYQDNGTIIPCIIGDIKSQSDSGCTKWGHYHGKSVIEFIVNKTTWYNKGSANPKGYGDITKVCHQNWNGHTIVKAVNGGSYFDNPKFGTQSITAKGQESNEEQTDENSVEGTNYEESEENKLTYYAEVATWTEVNKKITTNDPDVEKVDETTYTITTQQINYQELTSGYKMPFDYLWALLVVGEDKDFVMGLADLVYGSEIEITVHDKLTTDTVTIEKTHDKEQKTETEGQVTVSYGPETGPPQQDVQTGEWKGNNADIETVGNFTTTETTTTKTNTLEVALTKANVWIVDYEQKYTYSKPTKSNPVPNVTNIADEEYKNTPDETKEFANNSEGTGNYSQADTKGHVKKLLDDTIKKHQSAEETTTSTTEESATEEDNEEQITIEVKGIVDRIKTEIYTRKINQKCSTTTTTETQEYISSPATTTEKTDPNAQENNFVKLLLSDKCDKALNLILQVRQWLYEILETNDSTKDMVDLTKYLLYKVTGNNYGVTEYEFSVYDPENFVTVNSDSKSNINGVQGQIADFFLSKGMPIEGVAAILGNIQQECNFNASSISSPDYYGGYHGLCQWGNYKGDSNGRFAQLEKLAKTKGKDWTDVDVQLEFIWKELNSQGYIAVKTDLMNSTDANKSAEYFAKNYEKCINSDGSIQQLDKRQKYAKEWLEKLKKSATTGSGDLNIDTSSFLATAKSLHDYVRQNNYWYPSSANLAAGKYVSDGTSVKHKFPTKGEKESQRYIDCSAYVSWVLKEYGYNLSSPYTSYQLMNNPLKLQEVSISNVKAGDILVKSGHTEIFCGNGKSYNCGSTRAIRSETSNCTPSNFTKAFRVNK